MGFFDNLIKKKMPLLEHLVNGGFLNEKDLVQIEYQLKNTDQELEDVLQKYVSRDNILLVKALVYKNRFKHIDLLELREHLDSKVINLITPEQMADLRLLVLQEKDNQLAVAMDDPPNNEVVKMLEDITGKVVTARYVTIFSDIKHIVGFLHARGKIGKASAQVKQDEPAYAKTVGYDIMSIQEFTIGGGDDRTSGVRSFVEAIIKQGLIRGASDIHMEPTKDDFIVRYRVDGILIKDEKIDDLLVRAGGGKGLGDKIIGIVKVLSGESGKNIKLDEKERPQDGRIYIPQIDLDLRVAILPSVLGESVVIRIHHRSMSELSLDKLGFEPDVLDKFLRIVSMPYGMLLVSGPTGSGKTTTLYSILQIMNKPGKKILTIEDPVEYMIPGTIQTQINVDRGYTFSDACRAFLRNDPDVIMVGEIRDAVTASMAMEAALTGHMVLSSIHANDAISTVTRLREIGVDPRLVAATTLGTLAQRLVRRVCYYCRQPVKYSSDLIQTLERHAIPYDSNKLMKGVGCSKCNMTGYLGRIGIYELLLMNYDVKEAFMKGTNEDKIFEIARAAQGMRSLIEDALIKVSKGVTTEEEVLRITLLDSPTVLD